MPSLNRHPAFHQHFLDKSSCESRLQVKSVGNGYVEFERPLPYDVRTKWEVSPLVPCHCPLNSFVWLLGWVVTCACRRCSSKGVAPPGLRSSKHKWPIACSL